MEPDFEPKIMGFLCSWCSYAGADMAGVSRLSYPANIRVIRVMCSGRIDPLFVMKAFTSGATRARLCCHPGDCHYATGNYYTERRFVMLQRLLDYMGIDQQRLKLTWVSASEGARFATIVTELTQEIKALGPLNLVTK
ncbi:MAG: hydrogenase iron-sulfur subunit [Chloroflexaceae bacterium]|nr:hydrogenase iron-sulfur subunit [Chloroflexaceae bacterium]